MLTKSYAGFVNTYFFLIQRSVETDITEKYKQERTGKLLRFPARSTLFLCI